MRQLERQGKLRVAIVAHGTSEWEDLICGNSRNVKTREGIKRSLGRWGEDLLEYLGNHYVIPFSVDELDAVVRKIVLLRNPVAQVS